MDSSLERFVRELDDLDRTRSQTAVTAFEALMASDTELAAVALETFESRVSAAAWFAAEIPALGSKMPFKLILEGKRQHVIDCLIRMEHGMFS